MPCSAPSPKPGDGLTTFGKAELHRSKTSQSKKAKVNGIYACWLPSPSYRPGSSRRSLKVLPLQVLPSLVLPGLCRTPGLSRTTASVYSNCSLGSDRRRSLGTMFARDPWCSAPLPGLSACRTGLGHRETEIEKQRPETGATHRPISPASSLNRLNETGPDQSNPLKCRHFCHTRKSRHRDQSGWLWTQSAANRSLGRNSLLTAKLTANSGESRRQNHSKAQQTREFAALIG
jgi:hypothetical protein